MLEDFKAKLEGLYIQKVKGECVFCNLLEKDGEKVIYENENIAVFPPLKSGALKEGHLLVIPKTHHDNLFNMTSEEASTYFNELHRFVNELREKSRYTGVNLLNANGNAAQQSINHLHFHLVLREEGDDYDLWPKTKYKGKNFEEVTKELENILD